jgi:hypothetical protein
MSKGANRGTADIVFCVDASQSMEALFRGLSEHIGEFLSSLNADPQVQWDWQMDFLAHSAGSQDGEYLFRHESVFHGEVVDALYGRGGGLEPVKSGLGRLWRRLRGEGPTLEDQQGESYGMARRSSFFTPLVEVFRKRLDRVECFGDESTLVALDTCLDFPWRPASVCHRCVVLLSDEAPEEGIAADWGRDGIQDLVRKVVEKRIVLHMVAPESRLLDVLAQADRSEYQVLQGRQRSLLELDFSKLLREIGQSVSRSLAWPLPTLEPREEIPPALFGQDQWASRLGRQTGR